MPTLFSDSDPAASREKRWLSGSTSLAVHAAVLALGIWLGTNQTIRTEITRRVPVDLRPYLPIPHLRANGGGGGGSQSPLPASLGKLPRPTLRVFVPPTVVQPKEHPKLEIDPAILNSIDTPQPQIVAFGDPLGRVGPHSNGQGSGGGIGAGKNGGVGNGNGPRAGQGTGDGEPSLYRMGTAGIIAPLPIFRPDPEYSEEARKAKFQGTVRVQLIVDERGNPSDIHVTRPLGLGLDEKAVEAVQKWRFRPGTKGGKPVPVVSWIDVNFRLL